MDLQTTKETALKMAAAKLAALEKEFQTAIIAAKKKGFDLQILDGEIRGVSKDRQLRIRIRKTDDAVTYQMGLMSTVKAYFEALPDLPDIKACQTDGDGDGGASHSHAGE